MERLTFFVAIAVMAIMVYAAWDMLTSDQDPAANSFGVAVKKQHSDSEAQKEGCDVVYTFNEYGGSSRSIDCSRLNQKK